VKERGMGPSRVPGREAPYEACMTQVVAKLGPEGEKKIMKTASKGNGARKDKDGWAKTHTAI